MGRDARATRRPGGWATCSDDAGGIAMFVHQVSFSGVVYRIVPGAICAGSSQYTRPIMSDDKARKLRSRMAWSRLLGVACRSYARNMAETGPHAKAKDRSSSSATECGYAYHSGSLGHRSEERYSVYVTCIHCPVCGNRRDCSQVFMRNEFPILRCSVCGLGIVQLPEHFSPNGIYIEGYFQGGQPDGYSDYVGSEDVLRAEFRKVLEELRRAGCGGGKLLELGCAYGFFLT